MTIRELIDRLEVLDKQRNSGAHPNMDKVDFDLTFTDPSLDADHWDVEIKSIENFLLWGCACEVNAVIQLEIKRSF